MDDVSGKEPQDRNTEAWFERTEGYPLTTPDRPAYMQELQTIWELTKKLGIARFPTNCLHLIEFAADYKEHITSPAIQHIRQSLALQMENTISRKDSLYRHWCAEVNITLPLMARE